MNRNYDVTTFSSKYKYLWRPGVAYFGDTTWHHMTSCWLKELLRTQLKLKELQIKIQFIFVSGHNEKC